MYVFDLIIAKITIEESGVLVSINPSINHLINKLINILLITNQLTINY